MPTQEMPMKMSIRRGGSLLAALWIFAVPAASEPARPMGREVMQRVEDRPDGDDRTSILEMTLTNRRGRTRVREVRFFTKDYGDDAKSLMQFETPADVRGTAFLSWDYDAPEKEDDKWLYMPALRRTRRISGTSKNEYFMGTDFTYDDMGDRNVDEDAHTLTGEAVHDGHPCWVVTSVPKETAPMYTRKVHWIRKDADLCIRTEFYDKDGLLKVFEVKQAAVQDGFWTVYESEMHNLSQQHTTRMRIRDVKYNVGVSDRQFDVAGLSRKRH